MNNRYKPLAWMAATGITAFLGYNDVPNYFLDNLPVFKQLPSAIKQTGLDMVVNSAMGYFTLRSAATNWIPYVGHHVKIPGLKRYVHVPRLSKAVNYLKNSRMTAAAAGLAVVLVLTFPQDTAYLARKAVKLQLRDGVRTIYTRATCSEKGKGLDQLVREHGKYHKEAARRNTYVVEKKRYKADKTYVVEKNLYRVDTRLLIAIESAESDGISCAVSRKYARGSRQLMDETAQAYGVKDPFNVQENRRGSDAFFVDLMQTYEEHVKLAVASYNAGPTRVHNYMKKSKKEINEKMKEKSRQKGKKLSDEEIKDIGYDVIIKSLPETRNFVNSVLEKYAVLKGRYNADLETIKPIPKPQIRKKAYVDPQFEISHRPAHLIHS